MGQSARDKAGARFAAVGACEGGCRPSGTDIRALMRAAPVGVFRWVSLSWLASLKSAVVGLSGEA